MSEETEKREKEQAQLKNLVGLQKKDNEINDLEGSLEIIPGQIAASQKELEGKRGKLNAMQEEIDSLKKQRNQLEQDAKAEADHMAKTKTKLPTVKTNKEYTAMLHEIDNAQEQIRIAEDEILEIMEEMETLEEDLSASEKEVSTMTDQREASIRKAEESAT